MASVTNAVSVPVKVYLTTSYRPDRDWIDGEVRERNTGEKPHSAVQKFFILHLSTREAEWGIQVWPEQRVQTFPTHYRIPDVCATREGYVFDRIIDIAPILCVEVMSWDDRMSDMLERAEDCLAMGVAAVWVVDPRRRRAFLGDSTGVQQASEQLYVAGTQISVPLAEVFAYLDKYVERR